MNQNIEFVDPLMDALHREFVLNSKTKIIKKDRSKYVEQLIGSIVSQQLSVRAADTILKRLQTLIKSDFSPKCLLSKSIDELRSVGLSGQKAGYIHAIAQASQTGEVDFEKLDELDDDHVVNSLTKIKGVGLWTAEMFLIFTLGREDVFSPGDAGLRRGIHIHYPDANLSTKEDYETFAEKWSPYRSYACLALWHSLDNKK